MPTRPLSAGALLALVIPAMLLAALIPARWSGFVTRLHGPLMTLAAPVSWPAAELTSRLFGRRGPAAGLTPEAAELKSQVEWYRGQYLASAERVRELEALVRSLQQGASMGGGGSVRVLEARRVGVEPGGGAIIVRRGSRDGVGRGAVAVAVDAPQNLVGLVTDVGPATSTIRLFTRPAGDRGLIAVALVPDGQVTAQAVAEAPRVQLEPSAKGTLTGEMAAERADQLALGALVLLADPHWPAEAQMLIVGRLSAIEPSLDPLWKRIEVRPELDLARLPGVILRMPTAESGAGSGAGGGTP